MKQIADRIISFFSTETPVIGAISKFILAHNADAQAYVNAVSKEKKGEDAIINISGKSYRLVRAGAYHSKK